MGMSRKFRMQIPMEPQNGVLETVYDGLRGVVPCRLVEVFVEHCDSANEWKRAETGSEVFFTVRRRLVLVCERDECVDPRAAQVAESEVGDG